MKKLYRPIDGEVGGVCKGLSEYFNIDESIIRIIFVALFFTPFPIVITYLLMWIIVPLEKYGNTKIDNTKTD
jgi:phage shock protein PspC (stress-responsive transcriptional regulator)